MYFLESLIVSFWVLGFKTSKGSTCFFHCSSIVFLCFSKAFTTGENDNLGCFITLLWCQGSISSPVRYSYLSIFCDNNADIFAALMFLLYF